MVIDLSDSNNFQSIANEIRWSDQDDSAMQMSSYQHDLKT